MSKEMDEGEVENLLGGILDDLLRIADGLTILETQLKDALHDLSKVARGLKLTRLSQEIGRKL
jgi:hypothetical protein